MSRLPQIFNLCLAGSLLVTAGCHRKNPQPAAELPPQPPTVVRTGPPQKAQVPGFLGPEIIQDPVPLPGAPGIGSLQNEADPGERGYATNTLAALTAPLLVAAAPAPKSLQSRLSDEDTRTSKREKADAIFEQPTLLRIQIEIPPAGINALRRTRWESKAKRPVVMATVREGGVVYTNVAVHLKGAAGSFRSVDQNPAMTLNFDKYVPKQSFHGLHKISLNNSEQDSSFMCEKIARELFIAAGVPVPRASHATVELNGRYLGFYVLLEGANKQFLKQYFENYKGNLYDGGFCQDIGGRLDVNCGENQSNHSGLLALRAAVRDGSYPRLQQALDVDRFISMVALEMILRHWDGYSLNRNNWRVFHDLGSNRMVFIPHGLDQLFGRGGRGDNSFVPSNSQGQVTRALFSHREAQRQYTARLGELYMNVFKVDEILARIDEVVAGVAPMLAETDPQAARNFQRRAGSLKQNVVRRGDDFRRQLGIPLSPIEFGNSGILKLDGWEVSLEQAGDPVLSEGRDPSGRKVLAVAAGQTQSSGSWRKRVLLGPGKYQFEGRMRILGVTVAEGDPRSGAGLRISKGTMPRKLAGTSDWRDFQYAFEVDGTGADVELVCELKATAGEVWFDADSLRLVRAE